MVTVQNWLQNFIRPTDEELQAINEITETITVGENETIIKQGQVSDKIGFLLQGATRTIFTDNDGNERVVAFKFEGEPLIVLDSFLNQTPSGVGAVTLEPCVIIGTDYKRYAAFIQRFPHYNTVLVNALAQWFKEGRGRMEYLNQPSAKARYQAMCRLQPKIINRVPLKYIASHLGITQETLSRIRGKK